MSSGPQRLAINLGNLLFVSPGRPTINPVSNWKVIETINMLAGVYEKVYLVTYDNDEEVRKYSTEFVRNVFVLPRQRNIPKFLYPLIAPLIFRKYFREVQICRTHQLRGSLLASIVKLLFGAKIIVRQGFQASKLARDEWIRGGRPLDYVVVTMLETLVYHIADLIIVGSDSDKEYVSGKYAVKPGKIFVNPNSVDTKSFRPMSNVRKESGRVVFVGRFAPVKNVFSLVDAVRGLSGVRLYLIGDGPLKDELERKLRTDANDRVELLGTIPHERLAVELNRSEIFALPSFYEHDSNASLEAMACALPVVAAKVEGIKNLVIHRVTGLVCNTDSASIREAIVTIFRDRDLMKRLAMNARKHVQEFRDREQIFERELAIHDSLFGQRNPPAR